MIGILKLEEEKCVDDAVMCLPVLIVRSWSQRQGKGYDRSVKKRREHITAHKKQNEIHEQNNQSKAHFSHTDIDIRPAHCTAATANFVIATL